MDVSTPNVPERLPYPFRVTLAENAGTDGTLAVARRVAADPPRTYRWS